MATTVRACIGELATELVELWRQVRVARRTLTQRKSAHPAAHEAIELVWADTAAGDFEEVYARLEAAVEACGFTVLPHEDLGSHLGMCGHRRVIALHRGLSSADRCTTLVHEVTHQLCAGAHPQRSAHTTLTVDRSRSAWSQAEGAVPPSR